MSCQPGLALCDLTRSSCSTRRHVLRSEFTKSLLDEPLLYECFAKALVVPGLDREVAAKFMVLTGGNPKCDLVNLKKVCAQRSLDSAPRRR